MPTISDFFCGAGGSSLGMVLAGFEVKIAVNHWDLAIETHNTNHPNTDHYLDDIQSTLASRYPRTDVLWMSPECTNHSVAKGKKRTNLGQLDLWGEHKIDPAEERSRATMREVVEFTAHHRYEYIIVENVVDIRKWQHYDSWWTAMMNLGYEGKVLYLNSMFFSVPQSRDRYYAVFWKRGNRAPNLDFKPAAWCFKCECQIAAVQVFKKSPNWGRYGKGRQYTYRCPTCASDVDPVAPPAASVIDWNNLGTVIGDRKKALKPKTMERIKTGLRKFARPFTVSTNHSDDRVRAVEDRPFDTVMPRARPSLVLPFVVDTTFTHSHSDRTTDADAPLPTQTQRQSHGLTIPPFLLSYYGRKDAQSDLDAPLPVIPTEPRHGIVVPPMLLSYMNNATEPRSVDDPLYTIAGGHNSPLIVPPFLTGFYSSGPSASSTDDPIPTILGTPHHGLISFLTSYYKHEQSASVFEPMRTVTGKHRHALVSVNLSDKDVEEMLMASRFRMLTPRELKLGMSFPDSYIILGNNREQVQQTGNAVCAEVARWIGERVLEAMTA
jgi:DNA (cytosine-5)-methyltransferase 1